MPGPLEGIKILELIRVPPGAFCTMMLADMGAEVLKIETPPTDVSEASARQATAEARHAAFQFVNRNKQSMAINLKHPAGQKILHQLAAACRRLGGRFSTWGHGTSGGRLCHAESDQSPLDLLLAQWFWTGWSVPRPPSSRY